MNGTRPDAWSVQTGIDLDAMLAANAGWIERVRRKTKRDYQRDKPVLQRVFESLRTKYEAGSVPVRIGLRKTCNWLRALSTEVCASLFPVGLRKRF